MTATRPPALNGVRVLDLTTAMSGPYCTRLLADLGADVLKAETEDGDFMRVSPPMVGGKSAVYAQLNAGKRNIRLDLREAADRDLVLLVIPEIDVVVENFRPGTMERFGLGYEQLAAINPRLIYCAISGFGRGGPLAEFPAYAPMIHAMCGYDLALADYQEEGSRPLNTAIFLADILGGSNALSAILAALVERDHSGLGQLVESTLLDGMLSLMTREFQVAQVPPGPRRHVYRPLECLDGFVVIVPLTAKNFAALVNTIGRPDLLDDPRFVTPDVRALHWESLMALVEDWTRTRAAADCERLFLDAGLPAARYRSMRDVVDDEDLMGSAAVAEIGEGDARHLVTRAPFRMATTPPMPAIWVAELDRDGAAIRSALGNQASVPRNDAE